MACNDCYELTQTPDCDDSLELGTIDPDTEVYIYVKNIFTDYIHRQEALSDISGTLTLDMTEPDTTYYNQYAKFEIWVTIRTDNERIDITVSYGVVDDCLSLSLFGVNDTYELP